jgi:DNA replication protein DnaC
MPRAKKAPQVPVDRLDDMLMRLKLSGIRDQLDSLLDEASRSNLSTRETLTMLCEREIARKDHRRIDMALKLAHFPAVKELVGFTTAVALVAMLVKAHAEKRLDEKLLALSKPKLLIIDELGYLPLEPDAAHLFFQLVSRRYETGAMLITSNRSVAEWGTVFADPIVATAILDRLLHHSHVLTIRGDSYRLRAKRKSGLIKAPAAGDGPPVGSASIRPATSGASHQP